MELKKIYLVRHCEAEGQSSTASLSENGKQQALNLSDFFMGIPIDRIVSSPFERAVQSATPLARQRGLEIETDSRLVERVLSSRFLPDWLEKLQASFKDLDLRFEGGESGREAMNRIVQVADEIWKSEAKHTIVATHGNLMALLLKHYHEDAGFEEWYKLTNPDVFLLTWSGDEVRWQRIWA